MEIIIIIIVIIAVINNNNNNGSGSSSGKCVKISQPLLLFPAVYILVYHATINEQVQLLAIPSKLSSLLLLIYFYLLLF